MATLSTALTFARTQAQTDSNGLSDASGIIFANEALLDIHRELIAHGIDASQIQEAYANASANVGTYLYPTDMFFLKAIELNYQNARAQDYITATQVDVSNLPQGQSFSWLRQNANRANPMFDDRGDWYEIFPTPQSSDNLSQTIRIFYYLRPTEYTSTSDTIAYPVALDYRILGWRIASNYLYSVGKIDDGDKFNQKYMEKLKSVIGTLGKGSQQPLQATTIQLTGFEF